MTGKKGVKHYLVRLKREAVWLYQEEGKSYQEITELRGVDLLLDHFRKF